MKSKPSKRDRNAPKRIREERKDFIDYLDLLEARARNFGKRRYSTQQVKKILKLS